MVTTKLTVSWLMAIILLIYLIIGFMSNSTCSKHDRIGKELRLPTAKQEEIQVKISAVQAPFEEKGDKSGGKTCATNTFPSIDEAKLSLPTNNSTCTFKNFDEYFRRTGQFYGDGFWIAKKPRLIFQPKMCNFGDTLGTRGSLAKCLHRKKIRKILVTGDSNCFYLFDSIVDAIEKHVTSDRGCRRLRHADKKSQNVTYFHLPRIPDSSVEYAFTGICSLYRCNIASNDTETLTLDAEHVALRHFADGGVRLRPEIPGKFADRVLTANSKIEYLLRYYFPHHGFPDVWILSPAFKHEAWDSSPEKLRLEFVHFLDLLRMYLPKTTTVIFMGNGRECYPKQPDSTSTLYESLWNITKNERMHQLGQVYFEVLREELVKNDNYHTFLDAMKISCPLTCAWHQDGAHMLPVWYKVMAKYVLEYMCS